MIEEKNEILDFLKKYKLQKDTLFSKDKTFLQLIENIEDVKNFERPDAIYQSDTIICGIEHFQVSYNQQKKKQDLSRVVQGVLQKPEKIKSKTTYNLNPSIDNLINAIKRSLESHSKSFNAYKENTLSKCQFDNYDNYKLVIFIEDTSESAYIVSKYSKSLKPVNPLMIKQIAETILKYEHEIFGILYSYGNSKSKILTGCTINELKSYLQNQTLISKERLRTFHNQRNVTISEDDYNDEVYINLF